MATTYKPMTITLPEDLDADIRRVAAARRTPRSWMISDVMRDWLAESEQKKLLSEKTTA